MFAPSQHLARSYGVAPPGTTRRARSNNENAGVHLPTKTPVRAPLGGGMPFKPGPGTVGRPLGLKTVERNVMTSKNEYPVDDIGPKRLFQNTSKPSTSQAPLKPMKTPAPTRHALRTPAPQRLQDPSPLPLPSAQRTRRRSRSSLSSQHHTPDHGFATPAPAHRWEEEVSLDSIVEADVEEVLNNLDEDDYELEYAPPTAIDRPFIPEWASSIPDPVESIKAIAAMRPLFFYDAPSPPDALAEVDLPTVTLCSEDELEHPLLRRPKPKPTAATKGRPRTLTGLSRAGPSRPITRPATTVPPRTAITATFGPSKAAPAPVRPASATSSKTAVSRLNSRPATAMAHAVSAPTTVRGRSMTTTSRTTTVSRAPLTARVTSGSRVGAIRGAAPGPAVLSKPKSPAEEPVAVLAEDDFALELDLDFLGPDPAAVAAAEAAANIAAELAAEEAADAAMAAAAAAAAAEAAEAAEVDMSLEMSLEMDDAPDARTPVTDALLTPNAPSAELPALDTTPRAAAAPRFSTSDLDEPRRPKVTLTAPDTSADLTQDLDRTFVVEVADIPPPAAPAAGRLAPPGEVSGAAQDRERAVSPPFFSGGDEYDGETFEMMALSDIPDIPTPTLSPTPTHAVLAHPAVALAHARLRDPDNTVETASTTAESWVDEDLSFTDDILAAEMERCLDFDGAA